MKAIELNGIYACTYSRKNDDGFFTFIRSGFPGTWNKIYENPYGELSVRRATAKENKLLNMLERK